MFSKNEILDIRKQFPILKTKVYGKDLVYLDNAATTQKPLSVINELTNYYLTQNSNIHRGVHFLSNIATNKYEECRKKVAEFINASSIEEIIFTRGTTESINLVASSFGKTFINEGDEVILSTLEHHSNIVPWQLMCEDRGAVLKVLPVNKNGELVLEELDTLITPKTKMISLTHVSNALGTINPIKTIIDKAHSKNIPVLIDGAQGIPHTKVDVIDLDCDFYCFSGHKMYAPMGIGVLYGKKEFLDKMVPYQGGGEMIETVSFEKTTYGKLPFKFEAGTASVGDAVALTAAIDFINAVGIENIQEYENKLLQYATEKLINLGFVDIIGQANNKAGVLSFLLKGIHPYDTGVILDKLGIAVRTGHHCAEPIMDFYNIAGTVRASFAIYNTFEEIDTFIDGLKRAYQMLS
ncbi:MAG: aminotransferase class V-fold PLP-dependent enzyme [Bacteroidales bacterium]|jgi:cysteine desulfurase/selenocysteine lyase